jgi:2-polyprenyl-3-methyl-5-hydroxy-6-metoxy-1,4-benzoquinol methylase
MNKMDMIYNSGEYLKNNPTWGKEDSLWKVRQIFNVIPKNYYTGKNGISIADIGCGAGGVIGNFVKILKEKGIAVDCAVGFDVADAPLEIARKDWEDIEFINGNINDYDNKYDIGLLIDVVEHIRNPDEFVRDCGRHCRYFVFHIPLEDNCNFNLRNQYEYVLNKFGHINYYNVHSCLEFLRRNNMKIINYIYTPGYILPSARVHLPAKIAFIPRLFLGFISKSFCAKTLGGYHLMIFAESER